MDISHIPEIRQYLTVKEHRQGRLSLKVDPRIVAHPVVNGIKNSLKGKDEDLQRRMGILHTRFNIFTGSLIIEYDPAVLSYDDAAALVGNGDDATCLRVVQRLQEKATQTA